MDLQKLIKEKKFDWVNDNITAEKFPAPKKLRTDYKLYHFDRYISSESAIKEMEKEGYSPANFYELLSWKDWNNADWVVALGSVARVRGDRRVPCLGRIGASRELYLGWFDFVWYANFRFLAVRSVSGVSETALSPSDSLSLAIEQVKKAGYKVIKEM